MNPAGYDDAARVLSAQAFQLLAGNVIGLLTVGILGLWWKLHHIGMSLTEFRRTLKIPARSEPTADAGGWMQGTGLVPDSYRDDTGSEAEA